MKGVGLRIPLATYRLQFNAGFRFSHAREILSYLHDLGISDIYASPYFRARPGSQHGYDILDQNSLNPEIGGEEEYGELVEELKRWRMGQILDIVPNHMCIEGEGNAYWMDVLENGPSSRYAGFFDIDWHPIKKELDNKILIPILGDQYGTVLENGELRLSFEEGSFFVFYYDHRLPVIPKSYRHILILGLEALECELGDQAPQFQEFMSIITSLGHLPPVTAQAPEMVAERYREKEVVKRRLWSLYQNSGAVREFIDRNVAIFNGRKGDPRSFDPLDALIRDQVYRISHWRVATEEINYRRFFDINSLGAIRMEESSVFQQTHRLILRLVEEGSVSGLRVDHADGLRDPEEYFNRLQAACFIRMYVDTLGVQGIRGEDRHDPEETVRKTYERVVAIDPSCKPFYVVGEKILLKSETLPENWRVFSTTGYDFANQVNGLFIETSNARAFESLYTRFLQHRVDFNDAVYEKKKLVMLVSMSSEINTLGHYLNRLSEQNRHTRDFTLNSLIKAITEVIACFPVYRTYINGFDIAERDRQYIESAVGRAKRQNPAISASVFDFVRDVLQLHFHDTLFEEQKSAWLDFVMRFQQITGPVTAKGVEDTAFYLYNRLVSLNEVGGSPERFGITLEAFHGKNLRRCKGRPLAMLATSTHDTKRSEDVRARINVLSEIPERWREGISRWSRQNRRHKSIVDDTPSPSRNEEYLIYQTLVGTWPLHGPRDGEFVTFRARIQEYMLKAIREAKVHTSWISPNTPHEEAMARFIDAILTPSRHNAFLSDFGSFQKMTAACGMFNSLSQTLLKITSPGIPDFYQGSELWDFSLVDPDNRRPVDFLLRRRMLKELLAREAQDGPRETARGVVARRRDGGIKLHLTCKALGFRRANRTLLEYGRYLPLTVEGEFREHVCAFERSLDGCSVLVVAPRFFTRLLADSDALPLGMEVWQDTRIILPPDAAARSYRDVFTGETPKQCWEEGGPSLALGDVLSLYPVALLEWGDRG